MHYAGFWLRLIAYLIDWVIVEVAVWVIALLVLPGGGEQDSLAAPALLGLAVGLLYWAGLESSPWQATPGKLALGIRVTDLEGRRITFGRALGRTLAKLLSAALLMIGYLMVGLTARKQGLHDLIAGTLVVTRASIAATPPAGDSARMSGRAPDHPTPR